jgi:hypothetical protein
MDAEAEESRIRDHREAPLAGPQSVSVDQEADVVDALVARCQEEWSVGYFLSLLILSYFVPLIGLMLGPQGMSHKSTRIQGTIVSVVSAIRMVMWGWPA